MNFLEMAREIKEDMVTYRRSIHENPEIGLDLNDTVSYVMEKLKEMGIEPVKVGKAGVTGLIGGKKNGKVVLLRADMDALPMKEDSGLPFASKKNMAHTCGHDLHTAMLLGAAKILKAKEDELEGTVKLMFQPGEEILAGAKDMVENGILENPKVDYAVGNHVAPTKKTGLIAWGSGAVSASSDGINIKITGKGGHGASPQNSIDPINVGVHIHLAMQELISREVNPKEMVVLTFGRFVAGDASNIIPATAELNGTLRTYNKEVRNYVVKRVEEIVESVCKTYRAKGEVMPGNSTLPMMVDKKVADIVGPAFEELFGDLAFSADDAMTGSEDFSEVLDKVPGMFFMTGAGSPEEDPCYSYGAHHPKVMYNEECMVYGAAAYAEAAAVLMKA